MLVKIIEVKLYRLHYGTATGHFLQDHRLFSCQGR